MNAGYATIRGISRDSCTVEIGGYGSVLIDTLPVQLTADLTEHQGAHGEGVCALQWDNRRIILEITFRPASDVSQAAADAKAILIPHGAKVTLTGFQVVEVLGSAVSTRGKDVLNGDWVHLGPNTTLTLNAGTAGEAQLTLGYFFDNQDQLTTIIPDA